MGVAAVETRHPRRVRAPVLVARVQHRRHPAHVLEAQVQLIVADEGGGQGNVGRIAVHHQALPERERLPARGRHRRHRAVGHDRWYELELDPDAQQPSGVAVAAVDIRNAQAIGVGAQHLGKVGHGDQLLLTVHGLKGEPGGAAIRLAVAVEIDGVGVEVAHLLDEGLPAADDPQAVAHRVDVVGVGEERHQLTEVLLPPGGRLPLWLGHHEQDARRGWEARSDLGERRSRARPSSGRRTGTPRAAPAGSTAGAGCARPR